MIIIKYKELMETIVFIDNYYDIPLLGLCKYKGHLAKFRKMSYETEDLYEIIELSCIGKIFAKLNQWLFEICVGTHWSYKNGKIKGEFKGFTPLTKFYYWTKGH